MKRCPNDSDKEYAAVQPVPMNESRLQEAAKNHFLEKPTKD